MGEEQPDANQPPTRRRVTVQEAAEILGVTVEAVRGRIKRRKLEAEREEDGSVYVWIDADRPTTSHDQPTTGPQPDTDQSTAQTALIESLLEQVGYMREQLAEEREARRRADTIMAQLSQANAEQARTIRALEAPTSPETTREAPEMAAAEADRAESRPATGGDQEGTRRPWWRRLFGG